MIRLAYLGPAPRFPRYLSGYGMAGCMILQALNRAGVDLSLPPGPSSVEEDPQWEDLYPHCSEGFSYDWPTHLMVHAPMHLCYGPAEQIEDMPKHLKRVLYTAWESDRVPDEFDSLLDIFDAIWVPSYWNQKAFTKKKRRAKVEVVPHPFDPKLWTMRDPKLGTPKVFYTVGTTNKRKNTDELLLAYFAAFVGRKDVELRILTQKGTDEAYGGRVIDIAQSTGLDPKDLPPVKVVSPGFTTGEVRKFHEEGDCYVTLSRAEGFGLGAYEAMLTGNFVIAPDYGGFQTFLPGYHRYLSISSVEEPVSAEIAEGGHREVKVPGGKIVYDKKPDLGGMNATQRWSRPNLCDAISMMRIVSGMKPESLIPLTDPNRGWCSYETIAKRAISLLEEM